MAGQQAYGQQRAMASAATGFTKLAAEHAQGMVQLIRADRAPEGSKRELLNAWSQLEAVNRAWVGLLCEYERGGDKQFQATCSDLVHGYSESIGDYILDRGGSQNAARVQAFTHAKGQFYSALRRDNAPATQRQWLYYTNALLDYINAVDTYGPDTAHTWSYATDVLVSGHALGSWLDLFVHV